MTPEVSTAIVGAASALLGSISGGVVTYFTTKNTAVIAWQHEQLNKQIDTLRALHGDLLAESSRLIIAAADKPAANFDEFNAMGATIARIRLLSNNDVVAAADKLGSYTLKQHQYGLNHDPKDDKTKYIELVNEFCRCSKEELDRLKSNA